MAIEKRVRKSGIAYRAVIYRGTGVKPFRSPWLPKKAMAKEWEDKHRASALRKKINREDPGRRIESVVDDFVYDKKRCGKKNEYEVRYVLSETFKYSDIKIVSDWARESSLRWIRMKESELSAVTHRRYKIHLFAFSKFLTDYGYFLEDPLEKATRPISANQLPKANKVCLNKKDLEKVLSAIKVRKPKLYSLFFFLSESGCRLNEGVYLEWKNLDLEKRVIEIVEKPEYGVSCKWGSIRKIPMSLKLKDLLENMQRESDFVFLNSTGTVWKNNVQRNIREVLNSLVLKDEGSEFGAKVKRATKVSAHTLRHTRITMWLDSGIPLRTVQEWAGHRSLKTTEKYLHLTRTHDQNLRLLDEADNYYESKFA